MDTRSDYQADNTDGKYISRGSFGDVYKVKSKSGKLLAAKHVKYCEDKRPNTFSRSIELEKEAFKRLRTLQNQSVVKARGFVQQEDRIIFYSEFCQGATLSWHLDQRKQRQKDKYFSQHQIINWSMQLLLGLQYLHKNHIVHKDIKPNNIFVDNNLNLKIGDFGVSKILDFTNQTCMASMPGNCLYRAPQFSYSRKYSNKCDVWSLGCLIFQLCKLEMLFPNDKIMYQSAKIHESQYPKIPDFYSDSLKDFVKKMLVRDYKKRPSIKQLLKHQIFNDKQMKLQEQLKEIVRLLQTFERYNIEVDLQTSEVQEQEQFQNPEFNPLGSWASADQRGNNERHLNLRGQIQLPSINTLSSYNSSLNSSRTQHYRSTLAENDVKFHPYTKYYIYPIDKQTKSIIQMNNDNGLRKPVIQVNTQNGPNKNCLKLAPWSGGPKQTFTFEAHGHQYKIISQVTSDKEFNYVQVSNDDPGDNVPIKIGANGLKTGLWTIRIARQPQYKQIKNAYYIESTHQKYLEFVKQDGSIIQDSYTEDRSCYQTWRIELA